MRTFLTHSLCPSYDKEVYKTIPDMYENAPLIRTLSRIYLNPDMYEDASLIRTLSRVYLYCDMYEDAPLIRTLSRVYLYCDK